MILLIFLKTLWEPPEIIQKKDSVYITFYLQGPIKYERVLRESKLEITLKEVDSVFTFSSKLVHPILKGISVTKENKEGKILFELGSFCERFRIENKKDYFRVILTGKIPDSTPKAKEKEIEKINYLESNKKKRNKEKKKVLREIKRIVIDPGHGGIDVGALGKGGTKEKDVNLKVAKFLKEELVKMGFEVFMTRDKDTFVSLSERTKFSNNVGADIFVSLHCNASLEVTETSNGVEVFFLSEAKTDWERAVAALENASLKYEYEDERIYNSIVDLILMDMAQAEFLYESQKLAEILQKTITKSLNIFDRGVKQAEFYVLNGCYSPAVLIEMGFITTPSDERKLKDEKYLRKLSLAIAKGIVKFKEWFEKRNSFIE
ncbi:MAG: N-acetylmuramoyl-L-alanine amidase [Candidatus Hydrothermales bacterium]